MARLHIIDQSLCHHGGHHFDYVNCVARVARERQFETLVATNRKFQPNQQSSDNKDEALRSFATVVPVFQNTTYQRESWLAGLRHLKRAKIVTDKPAGLNVAKSSLASRTIAQMQTKLCKKRRRRLIAQFARDLNRYFGSFPQKELNQEDHVFFTTVSELELMGLAIFLANAPWTQPATWHLQFHYNLFDGRTPEFDSQKEVLRKVRGCFLAALSRVPDHDMHFYCTAEELVDQYEQLKVAKFSTLPYPINRRFAPTMKNRKFEKAVATKNVKLFVSDGELKSESVACEMNDSNNCSNGLRRYEPSSPVRMVCPGELRREKGSGVHLQKVVDSLWDDFLSCGRLQIAVQRPRKKVLRRQKLELSVPQSDSVSRHDPVIDYLQHPLSEQDYSNFVRGADFGLLLYDSRAYFSRRAGVLGELLACGKPVIVPAGCWLAHQLQESQFRHIEAMSKTMLHCRSLGLSDLEYESSNAPLSGGLISFDKGRHPFVAWTKKEACESIAIVSFDWHNPVSEGVDARVRCVETTSNLDRVVSSQVVGHRRSHGRCSGIFRLHHGERDVKFEFENAFHQSMATIRNVSIDLYDVPDPTEVPLSQVGIIAPDTETIDEMVVEMVDHLDHYQRTAETFSSSWYDAHDPRRTLETIAGNVMSDSRRAA